MNRKQKEFVQLNFLHAFGLCDAQKRRLIGRRALLLVALKVGQHTLMDELRMYMEIVQLDFCIRAAFAEEDELRAEYDEQFGTNFANKNQEPS